MIDGDHIKWCSRKYVMMIFGLHVAKNGHFCLYNGY